MITMLGGRDGSAAAATAQAKAAPNAKTARTTRADLRVGRQSIASPSRRHFTVVVCSAKGSSFAERKTTLRQSRNRKPLDVFSDRARTRQPYVVAMLRNVRKRPPQLPQAERLACDGGVKRDAEYERLAFGLRKDAQSKPKEQPRRRPLRRGLVLPHVPHFAEGIRQSAL